MTHHWTIGENIISGSRYPRVRLTGSRLPDPVLNVSNLVKSGRTRSALAFRDLVSISGSRVGLAGSALDLVCTKQILYILSGSAIELTRSRSLSGSRFNQTKSRKI